MRPGAPSTVTIRYLPGCPNVDLARRHLDDALQVVGEPAPRVVLEQVDDQRQAEAEGFAGSPTLLIDGVDPFPRPPGGGFSCRVYPTPQGVAGAPSVDQIVAALRGAAGGARR